MKPYPPFPPNYKAVTKVGGLNRTCLVIDLLSNEELDSTIKASLIERIEAICDSYKSTIETYDVVTPDRFNHVLSAALKLS